MIGAKEIIIDASNLVAGAASSDYAKDGGFSPLSAGMNLNNTPGVLYSYGSPTSDSSTPADDFTASYADDGSTTAAGSANGYRRVFVDKSASFYSLTNTTLTKQKTGVKTYTFGITDMVQFQGKFYTSSTLDVTFWDGTSSSGTTHIDETWWSATVTESDSSTHPGTLAAYPHPLLVYNKRLWIADGQYLYYYDGTHGYVPTGGNADGQALDLGSGAVIYALGIDPGSGQMLISYAIGTNASLTSSHSSYAALYDGFSGLPSRIIPTNDLILSFTSVAGSIYCGIGRSLGSWNGAGVDPIRRLDSVTYDADFLPYKQRICVIGNTLYLIMAKKVMAYGHIAQAPAGSTRATRVFYPVYAPTGTLDHVNLICDLGAGAIGVYHKDTAGPSFVFDILDLTAIGTGVATLKSIRYELARPIYIRRIRVFTTGVTTTASSGQVGIWVDQDNNSQLTALPGFTVTAAQTPKYVFDFDFTSLKVQTAQFFVALPAQLVGFVRMVVYYDVAE